ncbi:MAG TPA: hypothetical protein VFS11_02745 [Gemmatimonadales bacterium]|nr:hypothetical protein [Gemmatimonadales bacterium]
MTAALRPLSLGEILDTSFQVYRRHFAALVPVMLICYGPTVLIDVYVGTAGGTPAHLLLRLVATLAAIVLGAIGTGATVFIISEGYMGRSIDGREALQRATPFVGRLVLASFAFGLLAGIGTLFFIIPGIIIACGMVLCWPAIVAESLPTADAGLRRSWELTKGSRGRVFLLFLLLALVFMVPVVGIATLLALVVGLVEGASGGALPTATAVITELGVGAVELLIYPFFNCALTIMYYDLRVRREGLDLELLATSLKIA